MYYYNATTNSPWWIIIKPLWCHVIAMECLNSFPRRFFQSGGWGEGIVYSILSAFTNHLVTLKFDTSAICFLLSGETIFSWNLRLSAIPHPVLSIFLGSQGGQWTAKGALCSSQIGLLDKRSATTRKVLIISWQYFGKTKCYQQQEGSRNCCKNCLGVLAFYDHKTFNFKGVEEKFTNIAIWFICESNIRWKVIKERFVALLGKFLVVGKKCRKISVLRGNAMERFKDAHINLASSKDDQYIICPYFFNALLSNKR